MFFNKARDPFNEKAFYAGITPAWTSLTKQITPNTVSSHFA